MTKRKRNQEINVFDNIGKDILKLIASFLEYYDRLNMSLVCKLSRIVKPKRAIIGKTLKPKSRDQRVYEIGVEIPEEEWDSVLFEISSKDIKQHNMTHYTQFYEYLDHIRIYWKDDEEYNLDLKHITNGFNFFRRLELVDLSTTKKTLFIRIPDYGKPDFEYFTLFRGLDKDSILRNEVKIIVRRNMKEVGVYWPEKGKVQINCLDVGKCTNYKIDRIHGCNKIGAGKYSTNGNYFLHFEVFNKK